MACDVAIARCGSYGEKETARALDEVLRPFGGLDWVHSGMTVAIKANLVSAMKPETAATTHPALLRALIRALRVRGAQVVVGDSPGGLYNAAFLNRVYAASGMLFSLPTALLINLLGTVVMISLPYLIGTRAGSERVRRLLQAHPRVEMLREFQTQNSLFFAFITRLIGFFPSDLVGVAMGASGIRYRSYLLGSLMGLLPSMLTFSVMGVHARDVRSPEFLLSMGLQAALTLLSTVFYLVYRKKHRSRTAENEDKNR